MIVGIGVDMVNVPRFAATLRAASSLRSVYFDSTELADDEGQPCSAASLAARFAAKEALAKSLGSPPGLRWRDCLLVSDPDGRPWVRTRGTVAEAAALLGVRRWHVSMSADGDMAVAYVIAEGAVTVDWSEAS